MHEVATSRRDAMRALAIISAIIAVPAVSPAAEMACTPVAASAWDHAMAQFKAAQRAEDAYMGSKRDAWTSDDERELERLIDARCDAEDRLIATPTPIMSAVIWKIEYARKRWVDFTDWPDDWWASVMTDLRRFAGEIAA